LLLLLLLLLLHNACHNARLLQRRAPIFRPTLVAVPRMKMACAARTLDERRM